MRIAFIGLGTMGGPMALNLIKAGHELMVCDLRPERAEEHRRRGARWGDHPRACAEWADMTFTSLFGPKQIEDAAAGENGLLAGLSAAKTWIDTTTNDPTVVRRFARDTAARGATLLDSPVTGAVDGARQGTLVLFVGGERAAVERARPALEPLGRVLPMGPVGSGCATKLATNLLWFVHAAAVGEALVLAKKADVDLLSFWEAMKSGAADSFVARHDVPSIFAGHYDPSFTLDLCVKDLDLIRGLAEHLGAPLELGALTHALFSKARKSYGGEAGELSVARQLEEAAGVDLRVAGNWTPPWEI